MTVTTADLEAQVDGGSNSNIVDKHEYFLHLQNARGISNKSRGRSGNTKESELY